MSAKWALYTVFFGRYHFGGGGGWRRVEMRYRCPCQSGKELSWVCPHISAGGARETPKTMCGARKAHSYRLYHLGGGGHWRAMYSNRAMHMLRYIARNLVL